MTVALVCGGRDYGRVPFGTPYEQRAAAQARANKQAFILFETLDHLKRDRGIKTVIEGAASGADELANRWAARHSLATRRFKANWKAFGRPAGPIRNAQMLTEGQPDFVVAFEGGDGTSDMIDKARAAGVEVLDYRETDQ